MALIYLTQLDLDAKIFKQLQHERADESIDSIFQEIEKQNISLIKTKLKGRYNIDAIFQATGTERHYLIIKILLSLVVYDFIRRNAARKVPEDYAKDWEWAMKLLEKIKAGKEDLDGLPAPIDQQGNIVSRVLHGNTKNEDNYI